MDTHPVAKSEGIDLAGASATPRPVAPAWLAGSPLLVDAYALAVAAHGEQRRPSDGRYFLEHVGEEAELLRSDGFDDEMVAVGLLHDSPDRGTRDEQERRDGMGARICSLVLTLSEGARNGYFARRKEG